MIYIESQNGEKLALNQLEPFYAPYAEFEVKEGESLDYFKRTEGEDINLHINGLHVTGKCEIEGNKVSFLRKYNDFNE
ncbi:hypothetical protein [Halobacillus karajensis]|uniref:Uncharacterized protein n=1 Tax=Halobacillus karajensis TaxID=195088 RepID=A0A059NXP9_9BACI|nr:hypothetical protein [Halobacillus karajensis]CDQ22556.1 hypothetical protein BN983_00769 [Halobacillus karajensis]CDQ26038.1 hypothetical protein BN981_00249 [Halobacillus karajensis]